MKEIIYHQSFKRIEQSAITHQPSDKITLLL